MLKKAQRKNKGSLVKVDVLNFSKKKKLKNEFDQISRGCSSVLYQTVAQITFLILSGKKKKCFI